MWGRRSGHRGPEGSLGTPPTTGSVVHKADNPYQKLIDQAVADQAAIRSTQARVARRELRDRFAMAALPVLIGEPVEFWQRVQAGDGEEVTALLAKAAYRMADAMLAERDK